MQEGFSFLYFI